jgi:caspase domain-containing protein
MNKIISLIRIFVLATVLVAWMGSSTLLADSRDMQVQQKATVEKWPAAAKRFALTIGVDQYDDAQIGKLEGASNDARVLAESLVRQAGFPENQVVVLASDQPKERQPTRGNILRRLSNLRAAVPKDGLLVVAFSGHGIERNGQAYLLPADAQVSDDLSLLEDTAIQIETVRNRIREAGVQQVVIVLDACRNNASGRGPGDNKMTEAYARGFNFDVRNHEVSAFATLYATEVGYRAYESREKKHGYFTWALVEGLQGAAANEKGEVTLAGLVKYLEKAVPRQILMDMGSESKQKPFAVIEGYKADELVIAMSAVQASQSEMDSQVGESARPAASGPDTGAKGAPPPNNKTGTATGGPSEVNANASKAVTPKPGPASPEPSVATATSKKTPLNSTQQKGPKPSVINKPRPSSSPKPRR